MPASARRACYRFGRFELQPEERRLLAAGKVVPLTARAFDLLLALVECAGQLMTKDELLDRVWPKLVVEESNLPVQVSALRRVVGTDSIENVPGHGYRFTLEVVAGDAQRASTRNHRHNLPRQLTSFVGHNGDLEKCERLLEKGRLLTLTGIGGLGKTRLSLEMATHWLDNYPDGVWFVELAPLPDAGLVSQAVASVLGVVEQAGRPVLETVMKYVSDRRLLLILDNCEHLLHACAHVARQLLQAGPRLKILASSREPLHVPGETTYPLSPLSVPDVHRTILIEALADYDAVRLFVDRAAAAQPAFQLTKKNAQTVGVICARLDGIPLALELAAARVRVLSVETIAQRLNDRFRLLKGGDQTAMPRQQTLRATIDWSYDLLTELERVLFRRLAVFAGGWTIEAAEAVGAGGEIAEADILDLLIRLVEKSLVISKAEGHRYTMLETVRQYAAERLNESGESSEPRARHLDFYLMLAEDTRPKLKEDKDKEAAFLRLDLERENLLAAHESCDFVEGGAEKGLKLTCAIRTYWLGRYIELGELGYRLTVKALGRPGAARRSDERASALFAAGQQGYHLRRFREAREYLLESVAIGKELGNTPALVAYFRELGVVTHACGERASARMYVEESLALARQLGAKSQLPFSLSVLAGLQLAEGHVDVAEPLYEEALALDRERGVAGPLAANLLYLAWLSIERGLADRARARLLEAIAIVEDIGYMFVGWTMLEVSASLARLLGQSDRSARFFGAAQALRETTSIHTDPVEEMFLKPFLARRAMGDPEFAAAEAGGRALSYADAIKEVRAWLSENERSSSPRRS